MEVSTGMTELEQKEKAIEYFVNLERIEKYGESELKYQKRIARAQLQILGISTEDLELSKE